MNKLLLTLIFFSSLHFYSLGQIKKYPVAFPTPNVASFGRIEDPEVDLYRGTPNISIPLFNLKGQQLSTDIALNYDASGVRPENHPGFVGQNFQMIVSGAISRSVQGYPDELDNKICARMGFYYTGSALKTEDWASLDNIKKYTKLSLTDLFAVVWEGGAPCNPRIPNQIDTEPDIFVFNIGNNISGKFFFDENQQIKVQCSRKVQVIFDPADFIDNHLKSFTTVNTAAPLYSKTFGRFTIIDENGTKYTFGNNAIEYSDVPGALMFRQGSDCEKPVSQLTKNRGFFCYATTWYLESVSTSDDTETIAYTYSRGAFIADIRTSFSRTFASNHFSTGVTTSGSWGAIQGECRILSPVYLKSVEFKQQNIRLDFKYSKSNQLAYRKELFKNVGILFPGNTTDDDILDILNYTNGLDFFGSSVPDGSTFNNKIDRLVWPKLENISIKEIDTGNERQFITLSYTDVPTERLKLQKVSFYDNTTTKLHEYSFQYNPLKQPDYATVFCDAAGYNNGKAYPGLGRWNEISDVNGHTLELSGYDLRNYDPNIQDVKSTDLNFLKAEMLERIEYPSGGIVEFAYSPHDYSFVVNDSRNDLKEKPGVIGGLRISKISKYESAGAQPVEVKQYFYWAGYSNNANLTSLKSSGVLNIEPRYTLDYDGIQEGGISQTTHFSHKMSLPNIPFVLDEEIPRVGYTEVIEKISGLGYYKYTFSNFGNGTWDELPITSYNEKTLTSVPFTSKSFERGLLLKKECFDDLNVLLRKEEYTYTPLGNPTSDYMRSLFGVSQNTPFVKTERAACAQKRYYYIKKTSQTKVTVFDARNGTSIATNEVIEYDDFYNIKSVTKYADGGEKFRTDVHYNTEYSIPSGILSKEISGLNKLKEKNITNAKVEEINLRRKVADNDWKIVSGAVYNYSPDFPKVESLYTLETKSPILLTNYNSYKIANNSVSLDPSYKLDGTYLYDKSLLVQYSKTGSQVSYLWGTNKVLPMAEVLNATINQIAYSSFEDSNVNGGWQYNSSNTVTGNSIAGNRSLSGTAITKSGLPTGDYTLSFWAKNVNPNVSASISGSFNTAVTTEWKFYSVTLTNINSVALSPTSTVLLDEIKLYPSNSLMTTYIFNSFNSVISKTDPNNFSTYYEYDALNRLKLIRDSNKHIVKVYQYHSQTMND